MYVRKCGGKYSFLGLKGHSLVFMLSVLQLASKNIGSNKESLCLVWKGVFGQIVSADSKFDT